MKQELPERLRKPLLTFASLLCLFGPLGATAVEPAQTPGEGTTAIARIRARAELVVGMKDGDSSPFFFERFGKKEGLDVRIAQTIADELGVACRIETQPTFDAVIEAVEAGEVDIGISKLSITPDRSASVLFTVPYAVFRHGLIVNRKSLLETASDEDGNVVELLREGALRLGVIQGSYVSFARDQLGDRGMLEPEPLEKWGQLVEEVATDPSESGADAAYRDEFEIQKILLERPELALYVRPYAFTDSADRIAMAVAPSEVNLKFWLDELIMRFIRNDQAIQEVLAQRKERRRSLLFKIVNIDDRSEAERVFLGNMHLEHYDVDAALQLHRLLEDNDVDPPAQGCTLGTNRARQPEPLRRGSK